MTRHLPIVTLIAIASAALAQPAEYVRPRIDEAPALDASLDDACWEQAPEPPAFCRPGVGADEAPTQTRMRFVMDDEVLYDRFVVTSDLGFEPEGTVDLLVRPSQ